MGKKLLCKGKKVLAVILAAGMLVNVLPQTAFTALANESVSTVSAVSGGDDAQIADVSGANAPEGIAESSDENTTDISAGNTVESKDNGITGEIPEFPGYRELPEDQNAPAVTPGVQAYALSQSIEERYVPEVGELPPTRAQGNYGTCWAHSSISLAEIGMKKAGYVTEFPDYSELHLVYFSYRGETLTDPLGGTQGDYNYVDDDEFLNTGGNLVLAENILAGWVGAADEATAPYSSAANVQTNGLDNSLAFNDLAHLQGYYHINRKENPELVKAMIKQYGAVGISYWDGSQYFNESTKSYYCSKESYTNHAVSLVGWDDAYSADNFNETPEGNGAWLVRNSWVAGCDVNQLSHYTYFWISYYDKSLATTAYVFDFEPADNYDHNYQYDGSMSTGHLIFNTDTVSISNVFTAKGNNTGENLKAVGMYFYTPNTDYTVKIYKNLTDLSNPESGTLVSEATTTGTAKYQGYVTIPLAKQVYLDEGDTFSVVVTLTVPTSPVYIGIESSSTSTSWFQSNASISEGQSFYKSGSSWVDLVTRSGNLRLKAYTTDADSDVPVTGVELDESLKDGLQIEAGESFQAKAYTVPDGITNRNIRWSVEEEAIASISDAGLITAKKTGSTTVTASYAGDISLKASFPLKVVKSLQSVSLSGETQVTEGKSIPLTVTFTPEDTTDDKTVIFESSDTSVLKVDQEGKVTGIGAGKAVITVSVKDTDISDSLEIECLARITGVELNEQIKNGLTLEVGDTYLAEAKTVPRGDTGENIRWSVEDETIASISDAGLITAKKTGSTTVTAAYSEDSDIKASFSLNVVKSLQSVTLSGEDHVIKGNNTKLTVAFSPEDTTDDKSVIWESSDESVLTVAQDGTVSGVKIGQAVITVTVKNSKISDSKVMKCTMQAPVITGIGYYEERGVELTWSSIEEADSYEIYRKTGSGPEMKLATVPAGSVSVCEYRDEDVYASGEIYYRVRACKVYTYLGQSCVSTSDSDWKTVAVPAYRIIYHLAGGSNALENQEFIYDNTGSYILHDPVAGKEGYTFEGWYTDNAYQTKVTQIPAGTQGSVQVYAKWVAEKYTVIYDSNAPVGAVVTGKMPVQIFSYGQTQTLAANKFACKGYAFMGWRTASGETFADKEKADICSVKCAEDTIRLYAIWENTFTIRYESNGGDSLKDGSYVYGKSMKLPVPVRTGYTFQGWYTDNGTFKKKVSSVTGSTKGDLVLYAKWSENTYAVVFNGNGQNGGSTKKMTVKYTEVGRVLTANGFYKKGYAFDGWNTVKAPTEGQESMAFADGETLKLSDFADAGILPQKNNGTITLYAQWKEAPYTIRFVTNGGTMEEEFLVYTYGEPGKRALPVPVREGYTFGGWYKNENLTAAVPCLTNTTFGDMTLYAKWVSTYTVYFHNDAAADQGLLSGTMKPLTMKYETAKALTANAYKKNGYAFLGWALSEEDAGNGIVTYANKEKLLRPDTLQRKSDAAGEVWVLDLYPVWGSSFTVSFCLNGGTYTKETLTYQYGTGVTAKDFAAMEKPVKAGYVFDGWYKDAALKSKVTSIAKTAASNMVLYAKWKGISYKVRFLSNAPEGATVKGVMKDQSLVFGTAKALSTDAYKINGYVFRGWAESADADTAKYTDKAKITGPETYPVDGIYTLYAVWEKVTYTVTYANMDGFVNPAGNPGTYDVESETIVLKEPEKIGYTFLGWYSDKACKKRVTQISRGSFGNITLYAKWKANT